MVAFSLQSSSGLLLTVNYGTISGVRHTAGSTPHEATANGFEGGQGGLQLALVVGP